MCELFFDFQQGSAEWFEHRRGIPTASNFHKVIASGKSGGESKQRLEYMRDLAGEQNSRLLTESYSNIHMERGRIMEAEARELYRLLADDDVRTVGLMRNLIAAGSPDALVGNNGILEIKTAMPRVLYPILEADRFPPEHVAQCQGNLWIGEREWCDLIVFWPGHKLFKKRVHRNEGYIKMLADEVGLFAYEVGKLAEKHKAGSTT